MLVARAATRDARGVTPCRASRSRRRWTLAPRARHVVARGVFFASDDDAHIHLSVVARVPDAHAGAVLALAAVDDPDPDARFPWFVSTSVDGTVSTWHVEERAGGELELVRDASFGDDDAPWWCLAVDEEWLFAGTHGRKVKVRLAVDADLEKLPGAIANHTGWVRALASVRKTPNELERARRSPRLPATATGPEDAFFEARNDSNISPPTPTFGNAWRFSAACNVVRVWQDSFAFDEDDEMGDVGDDALSSAVVDAGETKIFTGDVLCLAGFQTATRSPNGSSRFLIAGVADGTVRGWRVCESPEPSKPDAPVMVPIEKRFAETNGGRVQTLFALAEVFPKDDLMSRLVVFGCRDGTLGCVDAETLLASPARVKAHTRKAFEEAHKQKASGVACLCAGPSNTVASGGDDGIVRLWRARRLSESEKTNDVQDAGSSSGGDVANVTCVSLEPAGGTRERTGDDGDDVSSPNARGEEEGEKTEKKSGVPPGTRCLCAVRDASGARVGVLAGDRAGGLTLYVAASSQ